MNSTSISIIIVNWNTRDLTITCLKSIFEADQGDRAIEIILIDNASTDGSAQAIQQQFPGVKLIQNSENVGYARANNQGIRQARGEFLILMNSDTQLKSPDTFSRVTDFLEKNPAVGFLGVRLVFPNGTLQAAGRQFISLWGLIKSQLLFNSAPIANKIRDKFKASRASEFHFCDYVDGAFLATRRAVLDEIGLLDESFFMYGEDMEWCARARQAGWKVAVLNTVEVIHFHAQSSRQNYAKILVENAQNNCRVVNKYYGPRHALIALYIFLLGMFFRIFISVFRNKQQTHEYWHGLRNTWKVRHQILK